MKKEDAISSLGNNDIDLEIETVKAKNMSLSQQLSRNQDAERSITATLTAKRDLVKYFYLPIVFKKDEFSYEIIARPWAYSFWVDRLTTEFLCLVVHDRNSVAKIIELGEQETMMLSEYLSSSSEKPSRATETRHKAISAGQICPFCHAILRQFRKKNAPGGLGAMISCENKSNRKINDGRGCDFEAVLSDEEKKLFKDYEFPTSMWLKPIVGKQCPVCGDQIFMRIVHRDGKQEYYERCRGYYRRENKCTHKKRMETPIS